MSKLSELSELTIIQQVLASAEDAPLNETLGLIARTVSDLAAFDFCGVFLPDDDWQHVYLAAAHNFPPRYADRVAAVFLAPVADVAGTPTGRAIRDRSTVVMSDALDDEKYSPWRALAEEFGFRTVVAVPLLNDRQVIGVLTGYSRDVREPSQSELAWVETLARQAALSLRLTLLVDARQETIAELTEVNRQLVSHRRILERAQEIHERLSEAVIAGADFRKVAVILASLIGRPVAVVDPDGRLICTSETGAVPDLDDLLQDAKDADLEPAAAGRVIVGTVRISDEVVGRVLVNDGGEGSRELDTRAVEHAATVLALYVAKERVARSTEERLRADFLHDLLHQRDTEARLGERAIHYGLDLGSRHRVVVIGIDDWGGYLARKNFSEAGGKSRRANVLHVVAEAVIAGLPGSLISQAGDSVTAAIPVETLDDPLETVRTTMTEVRRRVDQHLPGLGVSIGIGRVAGVPAELAESFEEAERCVALLGRLGRTNETIAVDELGVLGLFLDSQHPEQLGAIAQHVLGPAIAHDRRTAGSLVETLEAYLDSGCNVQTCAQRLYVHANTVKYRIKRFEEICDLDLKLPDDLLKATIARISLNVLGPSPADQNVRTPNAR